MTPRQIVRSAPAKINLYLEILGRRTDGFHELETVFQAIDLSDQITVTLSDGDGITLTCSDQSLPCDESNLAWKAAAAYRLAHPLSGRITIGITKRIPAGAGLGGGSADAAAVLLACDELAGYALGQARLQQIAATIGSDVAFLIRGGTAHATGRGEVLTPLPDVPPIKLTLLMPIGAHCATPAVYGALSDSERGPRDARGAQWFTTQFQRDLPGLLHNRLTRPACSLCPAVGQLLEYLRHLGVPHLMTGSGAACFALGSVTPPSGVRSWPIFLLPAGSSHGMGAH
ncbi:MAG: 4-(cytidine 5'-diphospho)-2-C-methyl-D-erythritol kinase [Planctomycetota bacterium]